MVSAYEGAIELLDRIGSSAPIRYELARAHCTVCGNTAAARASLDPILDSTSSGNRYWLTDEDLTFTLGSVVALAMDILVDEFRCTADPVAKAALLDAARGLVNRNLAHSVTLLRSDRVDVNVGVALMVRLMGPATEYQHLLQEAFTTSFEMIPRNLSSADVSWNLFSLARIISLMDGFDREARILITAASPGILTSQEDASSVGNCSDNDNDDDDPADEESEDDSDGEDTDQYWCQGRCTPVHGWKSWEDGPMYMCLI
jgi:hypothetical protein